MRQQIVRIIGAFLIGLGIPIAVIQMGTPPDVPYLQQSTVPTDASTAPSQPPLEDKVLVYIGDENTILLDMEQYLIGVLLAEMPTSYENAALQAQAVVARTYTLRRQAEGRHPGNGVCADHTCCQAYISQADYLNGLGFEEDIERAKQAVMDTAGMVLTYDGELIEATYFHCSGGRTEDAVVVWGVEYPYLKSVASPGEENMEYYFSQVDYSKEELEEKLDCKLSGTPRSWIGWTIYTIGGGVDSVQFAGKQYSGTDFRKLLKLNSTAFTLTATENGIRVTSKGKGHRVGMSQSGAQAMALNGCSCAEILFHYYPGTRIDKMTDVG